MKTVNFLEALEANKTKRVRLVGYDKWVVVGFYETKKMFLEEEVKGQWIIESKPMEIWVNVYEDGNIVSYNNKKDAEFFAKQSIDRAAMSGTFPVNFKVSRTAKFREVTDE